MDDGDRAAVYQQRMNDQAIHQHASGSMPVDSADECMVCGELIPSKRQLAVPGCQLCVHCAEDAERRNGRRQ